MPYFKYDMFRPFLKIAAVKEVLVSLDFLDPLVIDLQSGQSGHARTEKDLDNNVGGG